MYALGCINAYCNAKTQAQPRLPLGSTGQQLHHIGVPLQGLPEPGVA